MACSFCSLQLLKDLVFGSIKGNFSVCENNNSIDKLKHRQPVGDGNQCFPIQQRLQVPNKGLFRIQIQGRGRFVHQQNFGVVDQGPCQGDSLALTGGERLPTVGQYRIQPSGYPWEKVIDATAFQCLQQICVFDVLPDPSARSHGCCRRTNRCPGGQR